MECDGYDGNELETLKKFTLISSSEVFSTSFVIFEFSWCKASF